MLVHVDPFWVATSQQRRTRWTAHRRGNHEAREFPPLRCQLIQVRCADGFGAKAAEVAIAHVINEDEDDIGLAGGGSKSGRETESKGKDECGQFHGWVKWSEY